MQTEDSNTTNRWTKHVYLHKATSAKAHNEASDESSIESNKDANNSESVIGVTIRPIEHRDAILEQDFISHLSDVARRKRSPDGKTQFSTEELLELCSVDYRNSMAFVATIEHGNKTREIGVARYSKENRPDVHEAAVVVATEYRDTTLTAHLLESLISYAHEHGIRILKLVDFYSNRPLKALAKELGMTPSADDHDPHRVIYTLSLSTIVGEDEVAGDQEAEVKDVNK